MVVRSEESLAVFAIVSGIGFGAGQVGAMALLGHYWSTRLFPALTATGLLVQTAGGGLVPMFAGAYCDAHHSYLPVIYILAAATVAAGLVLGVVSLPSTKCRGVGTRPHADEPAE